MYFFDVAWISIKQPCSKIPLWANILLRTGRFYCCRKRNFLHPCVKKPYLWICQLHKCLQRHLTIQQWKHPSLSKWFDSPKQDFRRILVRTLSNRGTWQYLSYLVVNLTIRSAINSFRNLTPRLHEEVRKTNSFFALISQHILQWTWGSYLKQSHSNF